MSSIAHPTKIHFNHPPCNGSTLLHLPPLFGLMLSVVNNCSTHYFNVVNAFANVVLPSTIEGCFNSQRQLWVILLLGILVIYWLDAALSQLPQGMVLVCTKYYYQTPSKLEHWSTTLCSGMSSIMVAFYGRTSYLYCCSHSGALDIKNAVHSVLPWYTLEDPILF